MNKGYQSFIKHTESQLSKNDFFLNAYFDTYRFSSSYGKGYTSIYELDSYASVCIAEHLYIEDFEYSVQSDNSIAIQQYDSIESEHSYPNGKVYTGMQYINYTSNNKVYRYVIKKNIPAKIIGVQLMPIYYEDYLKKELGIDIDLKRELQVFDHGFFIREISFIFNQIRNFKGNELSTKLFLKSKVDEIVAIIIQKLEEQHKLNMTISASDLCAITEVIAYLNNNLAKNHLLSDLAAVAYMSISKFKYMFKAVVGQTVSNYLIQKRMEYASKLLTSSNLYISEIANLIGYKNAGSFSVQFKKYMGTLPYDYRLKKNDIFKRSN